MYIEISFYLKINMMQFQLPRNSPTLYNHLQYSSYEGEHFPHAYVSCSLSYYLNDIKKRIDTREMSWDVYKKYTNSYEYIHTIVPGKKKSVAKQKPLSRSYFKMIEIMHFFKLLDNLDNIPMKSFHLAEGPGGFIEALAHVRGNKNDFYIGMSILDDVHDPNIPGWRKSRQFLDEHKNVFIEVGKDKTGDILSEENFRYANEKYGGSMHFITGDGGFDFSIDFNNQEHNIAKLLFGQIAYAAVMQKRGGHFVLKIFDSFMAHTIDLLAILSSLYEKVYVTKPQTSRIGNSEKYIVCKNFIGPSHQEMYRSLLPTFQSIVSNNTSHVFRFLNIPLSLLFMTKVEEYNSIFGQQQVENIHYTLSLIDNKHNRDDKLNTLLRQNVKKSTDWCIKHNVIHNNINMNTNVFLNSEEGNI